MKNEKIDEPNENIEKEAMLQKIYQGFFKDMNSKDSIILKNDNITFSFNVNLEEFEQAKKKAVNALAIFKIIREA